MRARKYGYRKTKHLREFGSETGSVLRELPGVSARWEIRAAPGLRIQTGMDDSSYLLLLHPHKNKGALRLDDGMIVRFAGLIVRYSCAETSLKRADARPRAPVLLHLRGSRRRLLTPGLVVNPHTCNKTKLYF